MPSAFSENQPAAVTTPVAATAPVTTPEATPAAAAATAPAPVVITSPAVTPTATPAVMPKVYVRRTYEHQQIVDTKDHAYTPNLGRAGEIAISDNDKIVIGKYLNHYYKNTCAWEHDLRVKTCVAPAPATKRAYIIGYALPSDAVVEEIPAPVTNYLRGLPSGYKYVRVGNDVVLINGSTRDVIDAVTLASVYGVK